MVPLSAMTVDTRRNRIVVTDRHVRAYDPDRRETSGLTDSLPVVAALYNETNNSIFTAAGSAVKVMRVEWPPFLYLAALPPVFSLYTRP